MTADPTPQRDLIADAPALIALLNSTPLYEGHGEEGDLPERAADTIAALLEGIAAQAEAIVKLGNSHHEAKNTLDEKDRRIAALEDDLMKEREKIAETRGAVGGP